MPDIHVGDFTGKQARRLQALHAEEVAQRQSQVGLTSGGVVDEYVGVYDPASGERLSDEEAAKGVAWPAPEDELELEEVMPDVGSEWRIMKVRSPIEQMTYGVGTLYNFVPGKRYRVSAEIYGHLANKGLVVR